MKPKNIFEFSSCRLANDFYICKKNSIVNLTSLHFKHLLILFQK